MAVPVSGKGMNFLYDYRKGCRLIACYSCEYYETVRIIGIVDQ